MQIYNRSKVKYEAIKYINSYTDKALKDINEINLPEEKKSGLKTFARELMNRES